MKKKIAILASGNKERSEAIMRCFNGGNRVETVMILTDRENSPLLELNGRDGAEVVYLDREQWRRAGEIADMLHARRIDLIVTDDFRPVLPDEIREAFAHRIIDLGESTPAEATARLMEHLQREAVNPDHAWADALGIKYEENREVTSPSDESKRENGNQPAAVPPPIPAEMLRPAANNMNPTPAAIPPTLSPGFNPPPVPGNGNKPMPPTYLVWSIVCTLLCCMVPGIIAIIFSSQVSSRYFAGDHEGAERASKRAEIWIIVSFVLGVISATLYFPLMMVRNML